MANPILDITDGLYSVNLLETKSGIGLRNWTPAVADLKSGGVWQDSPLADGRRLVVHHFDNIIETFNLTINSNSQDAVIEKSQNLRRLLQQARDYWSSDRNDIRPVYIVARSPYETNVRYALIYDWKTPNDANPFTTPFFNCGESAMPDIILTVERGHWMANAPISSTCVPINNIQDYEEAGVETGVLLTDESTIEVTLDTGAEPCGPNTDSPFGEEEFRSGAYIYLGMADSGGVGEDLDWEMAVRFLDILVPPHAIIDNAYVAFNSSGSAPATIQTARIFAEKKKNPPLLEYSGEANKTPMKDRFYGFWTAYSTPPYTPVFVPSSLTTNYVDWAIDGYLDSEPINTDDISSVIQEMVDQSFWESGDDMMIYFRSYNNLPDGSGLLYTKIFNAFSPGLEPVLHIEYHLATDATYGHENTCNLGSVFVSNKHNRANLSHIYRYDASLASYSANLMSAGLPYDLLPATPASNDITYFGIDITLENSGPFCSLVFDIAEIADDVHGKWQYYNGATWADLDVKDNTSDAVYEESFTVLGVNSIHWMQPWDWTAVAINSVTAYWVRYIVTSVDAAPDAPVQQTRLPYTIVTPFVDIDAENVGGDIAALASIYIQNKSDDGLYNVTLQAKRVISGLRSLDRGANFSPYINLGNTQLIGSMVVNVISTDIDFPGTSASPTGQIARYLPTGTSALSPALEILFQGDELSNYIGVFRAFLRTRKFDATSGSVTAQLAMRFGAEDINFYSEEVEIETGVDNIVLTDMGLFVIQPGVLNYTEIYEGGSIQILLSSASSDGTDLHLIDLILMPADEWFGDTYSKTDECLRAISKWGNQRELRIDAIGNPRSDMRSLLCENENGVVLDAWNIIASSPPILQSNKDQRLWFLVHDTDRNTAGICDFEVCHSVRLFKSQRYFSMRGSR